MSKICVYHRKQMTVRPSLPIADATRIFQLVAVVETDNLEVAFEKTNHIEDPWDTNPGVQCIHRSRSTSVGDLMVNDQDEWFMVMGTGYMPIKTEEIEATYTLLL